MKTTTLTKWIVLLGLALVWGASGCGIGVKLCKIGLDCQPGQRCTEDRCQPPQADGNTAPIARIAGDGRVKLGGRMRLDGTSSSDVDLDYITFEWTFSSRPEGSAAVLENNRGRQAGFVADKAGTYVVKLTVKDALGAADEAEHTVQVNGTPTADAGGDKLVVAGTTVVLDGTASRDPDEDPLTFAWKLLTVPPGSKATLQGSDQSKATFRPDIKGIYTVDLTVSDSFDEAKQQLQVRAIDPAEVTPTLERLDPWQAPTRSIAKVNLYGNNFIQGAEVLFDDKQVAQESVRYVSLKHIVVELNLKDTEVGGHQLKIRNPGGKTTQSQLFQVDQVPIPVIASLSPSKGATNQKVDVTIRGTGFVLGAVVYFRGKAIPAKYIDHEELQTSLSLTSVPPGTYEVIVENDKGRRSKPSPFEVTRLLPEPRITRHQLSPSAAVINKDYSYLRLYGSNMLNDTQVLLNNKRYAGKTKIVMTGATSGYIQLDGFSSKGFSEGSQSFKFRNTSGGQSLTSRSYGISFSDPNKPSLYSPVYFHLKDQPTTSIGHTGKKYDYARIRGRNLNGTVKVFIDGKEYTGSVSRTSSSEIRLTGFDTTGLKEGSHQVYVRQSADGKEYRTNTISMTLRDGQIPQIQSLYTSDNTRELYSNRTYTYVRLTGYNFFPGIEVIIDGLTHKGNIHIENERTLYIYQVDTTKMQVGNHTLILRNNIGGKAYQSKLFTFQVLDGQTPRITRVRFSPSTQVYPGEIYSVSITATNVQQGAKVLIDGQPYTGSINVSNTLVVMPQYDTTGLSVGSHTVQLRNVFNGQDYDSNPYTFSVRQRPAPRLYSLSPPQLPKDKSTNVTISGNYFSQATTIQIDGQTVKSTFVSTRSITVTVDATVFKEGRHNLIAVNPDGQKSNQLSFDVIPDIGPTLWRLSPQELQSAGTTITTTTLNIYGYRLVNGSQVLLNKKTIGTLQVTSAAANYGRVTLTPGQITGPGEYKISVKSPDGKLSNETELWVYSAKTPEVYQISPQYLRTTGTPYFTIYGRGFGAGSSVLFNGNKVAASYRTRTNTVYSEELRVTMSLADVQQAPDQSTITIVKADGTKSQSYTIWKQTAGFYVTYVTPSTVIAGDNRVVSLRVSGTGFTSSSALYLDGKQVPVTFSSATRLQGTWQLPTSFKPGEYHYWEVRDGNKVSNVRPLYITRGPLITNVSPPFLSISAGTQTLTLNFNVNTPNGFFELFGKPHQASFNPLPLTLDAATLKAQKPGLYTIRVKSTNGTSSNTIGFHLIP